MKVSYGDFELDTESISQKGVAYLLQYGLTQSLSDVIAGKAKKLKDDGLDDDAIESALHTAQQTRFEAIVNGEVGQGRSGPRAKGLDKVMFEVAEEALKVAFSAAKKPWPTGKGSAPPKSTISPPGTSRNTSPRSAPRQSAAWRPRAMAAPSSTNCWHR
jgi:hypothetical protein